MRVKRLEVFYGYSSPGHAPARAASFWAKALGYKLQNPPGGLCKLAGFPDGNWCSERPNDTEFSGERSESAATTE
jgi:hypothetical protein